MDLCHILGYPLKTGTLYHVVPQISESLNQTSVNTAFVQHFTRCWIPWLLSLSHLKKFVRSQNLDLWSLSGRTASSSSSRCRCRNFSLVVLLAPCSSPLELLLSRSKSHQLRSCPWPPKCAQAGQSRFPIHGSTILRNPGLRLSSIVGTQESCAGQRNDHIWFLKSDLISRLQLPVASCLCKIGHGEGGRPLDLTIEVLVAEPRPGTNLV